MKFETITQNNELLIRRMALEPGEAMFWHSDSCRRFTVVVSGSKLAIEYLESGDVIDVDVHPGMVGWDDPEPKIHRAVNAGGQTYEEVVTFYKDSPDAIPQPRAESHDS